jgi:dodecin
MPQEKGKPMPQAKERPIPLIKADTPSLALEKGLHVAKVVEITSESTKGFEDAIRRGVERASRTLKNVQGAWVKEQQVTVRDGNIAAFRVNLKVTFLLEE